MKYRIYIDEVGNPDLKSSVNPDHRFLCLTGIIFNVTYVRDTFQPDLEALKAKYFYSDPDEPVIFHRKELVYRKNAFTILKNPDIEKAFNNELLSLIAKWEFKVIAVVLDKLEHNDNYENKWKFDPYHYCLEILIERYRLFLKSNLVKGDVMIESRSGKEDMRLKKSFRELIENGTQYLKSEELMEHLTSKEIKVRSKLSNIAGLQLADLLAHTMRRYAFQEIFAIKDEMTTFSDEILNVLKNDKIFDYKGKMVGYGINKLP